MTTETRINQITEKLDEMPQVRSYNLWKEQRIYINLNGQDRSFRGCRTHKLWIDVETGEVHEERIVGTCPMPYHKARESFIETYTN